MKQKIFIGMLFFLCISAQAADSKKMFDRTYWCERAPRDGVTAQAQEVKKIIIGHTVTDLGDAVVTLRAIQNTHMDNEDFNFDDIGFNFCLDKDGNGYRCRPRNQAPSMLRGHNIGSCGISCIGQFDKSEVTDAMAQSWGKHLGLIAFEYGFKELKRGENIFTMSELSEKYPVSPGQYFLAQFDFMVNVANEELARLRQ